ncbi:MAG TPA: hypothetical protein VFU19_07885 [Iamia sp.]|nr:hypothetical protein [Iamia sp.]
MSQNRAEDLDDDKLGGDYPPEEPLGADEYGTTAAEERWDEPLEERLAREEPDVLPPEDDSLELVQPDEGAHTDVEPAEVAAVAHERPEEAAPLSEEDIASGDTTLRDVATEHEGPIPAEEAAIHAIPEDDL